MLMPKNGSNMALCTDLQSSRSIQNISNIVIDHHQPSSFTFITLSSVSFEVCASDILIYLFSKFASIFFNCAEVKVFKSRFNFFNCVFSNFFRKIFELFWTFKKFLKLKIHRWKIKSSLFFFLLMLWFVIRFDRIFQRLKLLNFEDHREHRQR